MTSHASGNNPADDARGGEVGSSRLAELARDLSALSIERGAPSLREISAAAPKDAPVSYSTVRTILRGEKMPRQEHLLAVVRALLALDQDRRFVATVKRSDPRLEPWRERWRALQHVKSTEHHRSDHPSPDKPGDDSVPARAGAHNVCSPDPVPWVPTVAELAFRARLHRGGDGIQVVPLSSFCGGSVLAFSADGALLAGGGFDGGGVGLWNPASLDQIGRIGGHGGIWSPPVEALAFSPLDPTLVACGYGERVQLWDYANRRQMGELTGREGDMRALAFSPDGTILAAADTWGVHLWDSASFQPACESLFVPGKGPQSIAFSPDGTTLATGDAWGVHVWDLTSSNSAFNSNRQVCDRGACVAFSPDGTRVAVGGFDGCVRLLEPDNFHQIGNPLKAQAHAKGEVTVAFSPDGSLLATGGEDTTARLWDAVSHRQISELTGHGYNGHGSVTSVVFSPDGTLLVTGDDAATARQWAIMGTL